MSNPHPDQFSGLNALFEAAQMGSVKQTKQILDQFPDAVHWCHKRNQDRTALHVAAMEGHSKVCKLLLQRGANPKTQSFGSQTSLDAAIRAGKTAAVRVILAHHPQPLAHPVECQPPLWAALHFGNRKIFDLLIEAGADPIGPCLNANSVYDSLDTNEYPEKKAWIDEGVRRQAELLGQTLSTSTPEATFHRRRHQL